MKAIQGNLRIDTSYKLLDIEYKPKGDIFFNIEFCDNCNKYISNIATVENEKGQKFRIGLDCAGVLIGIEPSAIKQAEKTLRKKAKLYKFLRTECKSVIIGKYCFWAYKTVVNEWNVNFIWRGKRTQDIIDYIKSKNIFIIYDES